MFGLFRHKDEQEIIIKAPLSGSIVEIEAVPDEVFAKKMVGDGVAIKPSSDYLFSPVKGEIIQLFPTHHALGIRTESGIELLIHLGIDSVKLKGRGFKTMVKEGQKVIEGEKLIKIDWDLIKNDIVSTISPLVITNIEQVKKINLLTTGVINRGENLLSVTLKRKG